VRCRKAHWYLSARCDDTLSEKQRRDLAAHLDECPSCRREAFYFSEIKGQTAGVEKIRARADFNLRLQAKINAWEVEQETLRDHAPSSWRTLRELSVWAAHYFAGLGNILFGQRRFAVVGVVTALLTIIIWTGYDSDEQLVDNTAALTQELADLNQIGYELRLETEVADPLRDYLISGVSLSDYTSPRSQPNYVMPTIPAEQVNAQLIF
jgi:anti-sigma factor RsiW